jgi:ribonuclease HI
MTTKEITIYCDGGARGNPGKAASAYVVFNGDEIIKQDSQYIGISTNNVAEYTALLIALKWLSKSKYNSNKFLITFILDSELVVNQINGKYKVKSSNLKPLYDEIKKIYVTQMCRLNFKNVPRFKNKLADSLVNESLDSNG